MTEQGYPDTATRRLITLTTMAATIMSALDTTIANVALPHMQGSVSASQDEITWVLTSYIVASAIFLPLAGWLADRFGRKRVMMVSVASFTVASALCGLATNLGELVAFRMLQGFAGASLIPMGQAILLDINPPEKHGSAMALWGLGSVMAPIVGPVLGGWITENFSWRWVFYINVPVGIATLFGLSAALSETRTLLKTKLDLTGFVMLAVAVGSLQLMLDRGQTQDWFSSTEICLEAAVAAFAFFAFLVQMTTVERPFIDLRIFENANFSIGLVFAFMIGVMIFGTLALLPAMLQQVMGYPVIFTGLMVAPRGIGTAMSMLAVGVFGRRFDERFVIMLGMGLSGASMYMMSRFELGMDSRLVVTSGFIGGLGNGMAFTTLSTLAFSTLDPRFRNASTTLYTLIRSLGSAIGISVLQTLTYHNATIVHSRLVEGLRPDNPAFAFAMPDADLGSAAVVARLNGEVTRQATMVAYVDCYWAVFVLVLMFTPLALLMRPNRRARGGEKLAIHVE